MPLYYIHTLLLTIAVAVCYRFAVNIQHKADKVWLNPMLIAMAIIILLMETFNYSIEEFKLHSQFLNMMLEPAIVALGFPLYQQLQVIKKNFTVIISLLSLAIFSVLTLSFITGIYVINDNEITISLTLKSITTPIGLALTDKLAGIPSLTAITITIAGLTGAIFGQSWLNFLNITSPQAQGLAIGCASHALGTSSISRVSQQHSAFASLALVLSAIITAIIAPFLVPLLNYLFVN